jgi:lipoprotein signal peptidase
VGSAVLFLKPTRLKLVFLAEWLSFLLLELLRGELGIGVCLLVSAYPLLFFYLMACELTTLSQHAQQIATGWRLSAMAMGLAIADQFGKAMVEVFVPHRATVPILRGWLHLGHEHNLQGSWIAGTFGLDQPGVALMIVAALVLLASTSCHRYYIAVNRRSVWADVAFLGLFAGMMSWLCDMGLRGYVVDFVVLPDVVAADGKDILVAVGAGAFLAEGLDNSEISWRWKGWRAQGTELAHLAGRILGFSIEELRRIRRALMTGSDGLHPRR